MSPERLGPVWKHTFAGRVPPAYFRMASGTVCNTRSAGSIATCRWQKRYASTPPRTVLQHQAARLGDGPRSSREPDVRAPGYLPEVWTVAPESDLDASFSQRLVCAKLVEVLNVPANE